MTWETTAADLGATLSGNGWVAIAFTAIFIQFFIIAIAYMVGTAFNFVQLKRWTKSEFAQVVASVFLVALLFSVTLVTNESVGVLIMQDITERAAGGVLMPGAPEGTIVRANPFQAAYAYLRNIADCTVQKYMEVYSDNIGTEQWLSAVISLQIGPVEIPLPMQFLLIGLWKDMVLAHYVCNNYTWLAMAVYFQINFLQWIETSMFTVYLPIGILLRIFPYTRGAGGFLIALAIGLYLVYPLLFIIIYANSAVPSGCQPVSIKVTAQVCASDPAAFTQLAAVAQAKASLSPGALGGAAGNMIIYGYFYPLVILVVTFAFVRTISPFLGADIAEMGRSLFRII